MFDEAVLSSFAVVVTESASPVRRP